jgi:hypothetical protein
MSALLLVSLAMVNVPAYRAIARLLFGRQGELIEAIQLWTSLELLRNPISVTTDTHTADLKLAAFLGASAIVVLAEFVFLAEYVFRLAL